MQFHLIFSLISKERFVISAVIITVLLCCSGCGRSEGDVFTDADYSEESAAGTENTADHLQISSEQDGENPYPEAASGGASCNDQDRICVFVCGAVNCEGVYELPANARVIDAVNAAGGFTEDADTTYLNQAEYLHDAQKVEILTLEEAQERRESEESGALPTGGQDTAGEESRRININTAGVSELTEIPGIGESKAESIIAYRNEHGRFGSVEEIMNVKGIGKGVYEKIKDYITVQ